MKVYDMPQLSDEWFKIKLGKVGASSMSKVLAKGSGKTRKSYMLKLAAETLTGQHIESYQNDAMKRGVELEPKARQEYEKVNDVTVEQVGFIEHDGVDYIRYVGVSPDGSHT